MSRQVVHAINQRAFELQRKFQATSREVNPAMIQAFRSALPPYIDITDAQISIGLIAALAWRP